MVVRSNQNGVRTLRRAMNVTTTTLSCVERTNSRQHRCDNFMNVPASGLQHVGRTFKERVKDGIEARRNLYNVGGKGMSWQNGNLRPTCSKQSPLSCDLKENGVRAQLCRFMNAIITTFLHRCYRLSARPQHDKVVIVTFLRQRSCVRSHPVLVWLHGRGDCFEHI
jgi:hypothetical protein